MKLDYTGNKKCAVDLARANLQHWCPLADTLLRNVKWRSNYNCGHCGFIRHKTKKKCATLLGYTRPGVSIIGNVQFES